MLQQRSLFLTLSLLASASCLTVPSVDTSKTASAALAGQITRPDGVTGVDGPVMAVQLLSAVNASGVATLLAQTNTQADEHGRFVFNFQLIGVDPQIGTVNLSITPLLGSGLLSRDTLSIPVKIEAGVVPADTTYLLIKLQAR